MESNPNWAEAMTAWGTVALAFFTMLLAMGAAVALWQLRESRRARNAHVALEMSDRWQSGRFRRVRQKVDDLAASAPEGNWAQTMWDLKTNNPAEYRSLLMEPDWFENLAVLEKYGGIDFKVVRDSYGITVSRRWTKWHDVIHYLRDNLSNRTAYREFQKLEKKIQKAEAKHERRMLIRRTLSRLMWGVAEPSDRPR
ncbi:hypothetical protein ABQF26_03750 [Mycolicibacterium elephantis]